MTLKAAGTVFCGVIVFVLLKRERPEFAVLSETVLAAVLFFMISDELKNAVSSVGGAFDRAGLGSVPAELLLKTAGIALLTRFASGLCRDAGESAAAVVSEFAGKVLIVSAALPLVKEILDLVLKMVEEL